jgi:hypothetical protein
MSCKDNNSSIHYNHLKIVSQNAAHQRSPFQHVSPRHGAIHLQCADVWHCKRSSRCSRDQIWRIWYYISFQVSTFSNLIDRSSGFVGGGFDFTPSGPQLTALEKEFTEARHLLGLNPISSGEADDTLPIGVGFLTFNAPTKPQAALIPLLRRHRPAAVWLFAPESPEQHVSLIASLKAASEPWGLKVFVQVGTIQSAMEAVQHGADVLVVQGSDAGGHQFAGNSSIITLLPEIHDLLKAIGNEIPVLAAGGIMDGRGMAAALALGIWIVNVVACVGC